MTLHQDLKLSSKNQSFTLTLTNTDTKKNFTYVSCVIYVKEAWKSINWRKRNWNWSRPTALVKIPVEHLRNMAIAMCSAHIVVSLFFPLIRWCLKLESWPEKLLFWNQHRTFLQIAFTNANYCFHLNYKSGKASVLLLLLQIKLLSSYVRVCLRF